MKILTATLIACALLTGCQSTSNGGNNVPTRTKSFKYSNDDGSTRASAVEIIRDTVLKKAYNMITIIDVNNTSKRVYFDITSYYRTMTTQFPDSKVPLT